MEPEGSEAYSYHPLDPASEPLKGEVKEARAITPRDETNNQVGAEDSSSVTDLPRRTDLLDEVQRAASAKLMADAALELSAGEEYAAIVKAIPEDGSTDIDIPADCWGAFIFIIVSDFPDMFAGNLDREGIVRVAFTLALFLSNLYCQAMLLLFIGSKLMLPGMHSAQNVYREFHQHAFINGQLDPDAWDSLEGTMKQEICELAMAQKIFVRVILFLWITTNAGEMKTTNTQRSAIAMLPPLPEGRDTRLMVKDEVKEGKYHFSVVCINTVTRSLLNLLVFLPKFVIASLLAITGSYWLLSAEGVGDLILNSLALAFVTQVDELFASVFFPDFFYEHVQHMVIALPDSGEHAMLHADTQVAKAIRTKRFLLNTALLVTCAVGVECIIKYQLVLPGYQFDVAGTCAKYFWETRRPWCAPGQEGCFPFGAGAGGHEGENGHIFR